MPLAWASFINGCRMSDPIEIYNWRRVNDRLTTSGQPSEEQLASLRNIGIHHVINLGLHSHEKALPDEARSLAAIGLKYYHIPVAFDRPTDDDFIQFCDVMRMIGSRPVHVHCIANFRVTAFIYRWQRDVLRLADDRAREVMESVWQPGGVWAEFIGDLSAVQLPHRPPKSQGEV